MKIVSTVNGSVELRLSPENPLEEAILHQIATSATMGKKTVVSGTAQELVVRSEY